MPNFADALFQGMDDAATARQRQQSQLRQNRMDDLSIQKAEQGGEDRRREQLVQLARGWKSVRPEQRQGYYQRFVHPAVSQMGFGDLGEYNEAEVDGVADQILAAYGNAGQAGEQFTLSPGSRRFDASGKVVAEVPFAPANAQLVDVPDGQGGKVQMLFDPRTNQFSQPNYGGQPAPATSPTGGGQLDPVADYGQFGNMPGVRTTSLYRDPERNARVGGVSNSQHMAGTAGDFVVPAEQKAQFIAQAKQSGYEAIDEGDHVHVELPKGAQASSRFGAGQQGGRLGYTPGKSEAENYSTLTAQEVQAMGLPAGTIAQRSPNGQVQIINKPRDLPTGGQVIDNGDGTTTYIPAGKVNEGERNAAGFYQRMVAATQEMDALTKGGYDPTNVRDFATSGSNWTNFAASPQGQQWHQAAMNWVRANLRKESGAAIGVDEARQEIRNYFPVPGDSKEVIAQKARNRQTTERAMRQAAGGALAPPGQAGAPKERRARNPQTGEVLVLRNGQWVKE